jgi:hypothetical protein
MTPEGREICNYIPNDICIFKEKYTLHKNTLNTEDLEVIIILSIRIQYDDENYSQTDREGDLNDKMFEFIDFLFDNGLDPNYVMEFPGLFIDYPLIFVAVRKSTRNMIRHIIKRGADPFVVSKQGETLFMLSVRHCRGAPFVQFMLDDIFQYDGTYNPYYFLKNINGESAWFSAELDEEQEILLRMGFDINEKCNQGLTHFDRLVGFYLRILSVAVTQNEISFPLCHGVNWNFHIFKDDHDNHLIIRKIRLFAILSLFYCMERKLQRNYFLEVCQSFDGSDFNLDESLSF